MGKNYTGIVIKLLIGIALIIGAWWVVKCQCVNLKSLTPASLRDFIQSFGRLAVLVYILAYALNTVSIVPPIAALSLAAGLIFGALWGAVYLMAGAMIGISLTFMISRHFGRGLVDKILKGKFKDLDEKLAQNGFMTVLFFRVIPLVPYEVLNYAAGLSRIKFKDYFWATFLGLIPGVVTAAFFGGSLGEIRGIKDILSPKFLIAIGLMAIIILIPVIYQIARKHFSKTNETNYFKCKICGLLYKDKNWALKCEEWCAQHRSCNLEITKHAVKEVY
ncbi:MAG: TVP38/TMEM64 family protein [Candidatus Omnitrophota bacterium]